MPRKAHGSTFTSDGAIFARVVVAPKEYVARSLAGTVAVDDEAGARAWASTLQELVDALRELGRTGDVTESIDTAVSVGRDDPSHGLERVRKSLRKLRGDVAEKRIEHASRAPKSKVLTFRRFGESWTSGELHRAFPDHAVLKRSADADASRLETHVYASALRGPPPPP